MMTMHNVPQLEPSIWHLLLAWIAYRLSEIMASMKPKHNADEVAAAVVRSGNPPGV